MCVLLNVQPGKNPQPYVIVNLNVRAWNSENIHSTGLNLDNIHVLVCTQDNVLLCKALEMLLYHCITVTLMGPVIHLSTCR